MNKQTLIDQINNSPEPLRSYIHGIETCSIADLVWENEKLRQENEGMKTYLSKKEYFRGDAPYCPH